MSKSDHDVDRIVTCRRCGRKVNSINVGLSRRDNKTELCSECCHAEARVDFYRNYGILLPSWREIQKLTAKQKGRGPKKHENNS